MSGGTANKNNRQHATTDKQEAAKIVVGLSTQLITAALAFIALNGGIITFVLTNNEPTIWFYILFVGTLASFVFSIFFGGKGIDFVKKTVIEGKWDTKDDKKNWFDWQTKAIILGIILSIFLPFTGKKANKTELNIQKVVDLIEKTTKLNANLYDLQKKDSLNQAIIFELQSKINILSKQIREASPRFKTK